MYNSYPVYNVKDDRFIGGGFLAPFVLGGITGGLVAPYFNRPNYYYPVYPPRPYPPRPRPYPPRW